MPTTTASIRRRVTTGRTLNIAPRWSPDGRSIAYTSYRRGGANLFISNIFQGTLDEVTKGDKVGENWLPAWSPDGTKLAFSSTRDGNPEIYVVNRDGSGLRRLTNNPSIDITPTWSPSGTQIAFTSDRSGSPQIYVVGADGLNLSKKTSESVLRSAHVVSRAVQRDRVRRAQRAGIRHPGAGPGDERHQVHHVRRRYERKPGVLSEWPPHRLHLDALRQDAGVHDGARRQGRKADYESRQQLRTGLVQMTGASTMKAARSIATLVALATLLTAAACGKKTPPVARPMPPPPPPAETVASSAAGSARAGPRAGQRAARSGSRRRDFLGVARRAQQELTAEAGVLRVGQQRSERRQSADARRERGAHQALLQLDRDRSKDTATSAGPPSTIWRWVSAARWPRAPTLSRWGSPPRG